MRYGFISVSFALSKISEKLKKKKEVYTSLIIDIKTK